MNFNSTILIIVVISIITIVVIWIPSFLKSDNKNVEPQMFSDTPQKVELETKKSIFTKENITIAIATINGILLIVERFIKLIKR